MTNVRSGDRPANRPREAVHRPNPLPNHQEAGQAGAGPAPARREGTARGWRLKWPWQRGKRTEDAGPTAPPALTGSLAETGVAQVVHLLAGGHKSGRLAVQSGRWAGEVWLAQGRVVAAFCAGVGGRDALDAIALGFGGGSFAFYESEQVPPGHFAPPLAPEQVAARSAGVPSDHLAAVVRDLTVVPRMRPRDDAGADLSAYGRWALPAPTLLDPPMLRLYLAVDGVRTVDQLAERFGLARTARDLARLSAMGLVSAGPLSPPPPEAPPLPATPATPSVTPAPSPAPPPVPQASEPSPPREERPAPAGSFAESSAPFAAG